MAMSVLPIFCMALVLLLTGCSSISVVGSGTSEATSSPTASTIATAKHIASITMTDSAHGWALTGSSDTAISTISSLSHVLVTNDGGVQWSDVTPNYTPVTNANQQGICAAFRSGSQAMLVVQQPNKQAITTFRTTDAGHTWLHTDIADDGSGAINGCTFITDQVGYFSVRYGSSQGSNYLNSWVTDNGGVTWQKMPMDSLKTPGAISASFSSTKDVWVTMSGITDPVLSTTALMHSGDRGKTWKNVSLPYPTIGGVHQIFLHAPIWITPQTSVIQEELEDGTVFPFITQDGGTTWTNGSLSDSFSMLQFLPLDPTHWWAVSKSDGAVWQTTDGGNTWKTVVIGSASVLSLDFLDRTYGWAAATNGIWSTSDGGQHWSQIVS
jgi:photosystem II stability/assembly factor-like uncharacterized protein